MLYIPVNTNFDSIPSKRIYKLIYFRCGALNDAYQDILATKDTDPSSTIAYQLLIDMPQLYTNFAKTGYNKEIVSA